MKKTIFEGAATALITPFDANGKIDYKKFAELVEFQIAEGINALVVCGTTGEASTLTDDADAPIVNEKSKTDMIRSVPNFLKNIFFIDYSLIPALFMDSKTLLCVII